MAQNLNLVLRISGDASGLKAEIVGAKREVEGLGASGASAGQQASGGLGAAAAAAMRLAGSLVAVGGAASGILAVARAGDTANAAIGRLSVATGSLESAVDVYGRLYDLSLRTGVSVAEAAGAFQRFAIAAREAGATQAQILSIVQLMQQAGALAGATTQETASATMQLGQALASGRLQGDELRSIMEAMPNLAEALARELGVGVGELRKLGEEGKLTADVVIPALQRSAARMNEEFEKLPPSLERSMGVLRQASAAFLADLDRAAGLSVFLARALGREGVAGSLDTARRELGLGSDIESAEVEVRRRASALIEARRNAGRADEFGLNEGGVERAFAELREAEARLAALRQGAREREAANNEASAAGGADNSRRQSEQQITELREQLDRRLAIRREAAEREATITRALANNAITAEEAARDRAAIAAREREQLAALNRAPAARPGADPFEGMQRRAEQLTQSLRTPLETYSDAVQEATRLNRLFEASQGQVGISAETMSRAIERARDEYERTRPRTEAEREAETMRRTFEDLGRLGERAFDRVGQSITQALAQGQLDFRRLNQVGLAVASELTQAFLQLAVLNPIKNAMGMGGGGATTLLSLGMAMFGGFGGAGGAPALSSGDISTGLTMGANSGGLLLHSGGVVGADAVPVRRAPPSVFATAPRYHSGGFVGPDEQPAILRRGEGVFTPEQMARMGPAGGAYTFAPTIHFSGNAGSDDDRQRFMAQMQALWRADLMSAVPGIVGAAQGAIRADVQRRGASRALGMMA